MHWIDPDCLPETTGTVDRFILNPEGEADGLILADGTEVHFPPHMAKEMLKGVRAGSLVKIRGVRPRGTDMIAAVAFETETGARIVDNGPSEKDHDRKAARERISELRTDLEIEGVVGRALHGPKGEVRGLVLVDGRIGRFPPHAGEALQPLLASGTRVVLKGPGLVGDNGTVVAVHEIGPSRDDLTRVGGKHPKPRVHGSGGVG